MRWWWGGEGLSAPDVLIAREERDEALGRLESVREQLKAMSVMLEARESELTIRKRDCQMLAEIIKREQVRVQAETAMAHRALESRRDQ